MSMSNKYGMTNKELLLLFKDFGVDDYKDLLAEVVRLREGIKAYLDLEIETHELKELIE